MMTPEQAAYRFFWGLMLGAGLGLLYGFLRPLRRRVCWPADILFVGAAFYAWLYLSFAVCRGDIRIGITAALAIGALLWELPLGKLLRRPFAWFWRLSSRMISFLCSPFQKFFQIIMVFFKKVFQMYLHCG